MKCSHSIESYTVSAPLNNHQRLLSAMELGMTEGLNLKLRHQHMVKKS